jgi:hypothetical protein
MFFTRIEVANISFETLIFTLTWLISEKIINQPTGNFTYHSIVIDMHVELGRFLCTEMVLSCFCTVGEGKAYRIE